MAQFVTLTREGSSRDPVTVNVDQVLWMERHTDSTILTMNTQQWSVSVVESVEEILDKLKARYG